MKQELLVSGLRRECQAVRRMAPVRLPEFYAMPGSIRLPEELVQTEALPLGLLVSQQPLCAEECHEPMHIGMLRHQRPVKPTGLVVLAISVVVTLLGAPYFVAHQNHRQTQREYRHGQKVLHLPVSQLLDGRIIGGALDTPIAASVVVRAIAVGFAVQLVVPLVVGDEVIEREPVVTGYKVHTLLSLAFLVTINLRAAKQPVSKGCHRPLVATKKAANIVAEPAIPFPPTVPDEATDLVQAARVPGLSDELCARERRVRLDIPQHWRARHPITPLVAIEDRCQIEPEAIHVHRFNPIAKTIHDHPADDGMIGLERVSCAAVIGVT